VSAKYFLCQTLQLITHRYLYKVNKGELSIMTSILSFRKAIPEVAGVGDYFWVC
jgi:hypothetical protein